MRLGISISLAVLWMELVHGLRLSVWGVSFFGHFLVKVDLPLGQVVIDPVHEKSLSREVLVERLEPFLRRNKLSYRMETPLGLYLRAAPSRGIIARASNNLKEIYRVRRDWNRMFATHERLIVLLQFAWSKYRDRGLTHAELVNTEQALADLEFYPVHAGTSVYRLGCNC